MPGIQWLRYEEKKAARDILHGYYDAAISKCGIMSMFLEYVVLRTNGLVVVRDKVEIFEQLDKLGGQDDRLRLLINRGVLTMEQAEILWKMAQYRIRHLSHLSQFPRYFGARCFVDGVQTVLALNTLLNDEGFCAKIPTDLVPECIWGFWIG